MKYTPQPQRGPGYTTYSLVRTGTLHVIDIFSKRSSAGPVLLDGVTLFDWIQGNFISLHLVSEELF